MVVSAGQWFLYESVKWIDGFARLILWQNPESKPFDEAKEQEQEVQQCQLIYGFSVALDGSTQLTASNPQTS